jgi:N-methylhydantoinase B
MTVTNQIGNPTTAAAGADPVVSEIVRNALKAAAKQIELAIIRTTVTPILYDAHDFACGIFDDRARLLGQDDGVPGFLGTLGPAIEASVAQCGGLEQLHDGDVILTTDAYSIGSHAQDVTIVVPSFFEDELIGFAAVKGHITDIGQVQTMQAVDSTDIWQEGTIYPGVKIFREGVRNDDLWRVLVANSRLPDALAADVNAFIGAARVGVQALGRVVGRFGVAGFRAAVQRIFAHGEEMARAAISRIPDGRYTAETVIEGADAAQAVPFEIAVEVSGSDIVIDFTGAPAQISAPFNAPVGFATATVRAFVLALIGSADSANEGYMAPIELRTTPGTMLHPLAPAPVSLYFGTLDPPEAVYRALAQVIPNAIPGSVGGGTQWFMAFGMTPTGGFWGGGFNFIGGQGGSPTHDGAGPMLGIAGGGVRSVSCEIFESRTPFVIDEIGFAADSAGAGEYRGAPGLNYRIRALEQAFATLIVDGVRYPPGRGINGGQDGRANQIELHGADGEVTSHQKDGGLLMAPGAFVAMQSGGGGGYGPRSKRDPAAVHTDISDGLLSEEEARRLYPQAF